MMALNIENYPLKLSATRHADAAEALEAALASYLGYGEVIVLDAVESAFDLALSALKPDCGVLCSPNAPLSLYRALKQRRLQAEYCDLRLDGTMESRFLEKAKSQHSGALILSHNYGLLSDTASVQRFAQENGLYFIEDATRAFGPRPKSGAAAALYSLEALVPSFIAGGAFIATDDPELAAALREQAKGGYAAKKFWNYDIVTAGADLRLSPLSAQLALEAMREIEIRRDRIEALQRIYLDTLADNRLVELPEAAKMAHHPLFPIALIPALFCPKEDIYTTLIDAGIPVKVGNKPIYKTTAYADETLSLFGAEEVFKAQLLLPSHHLMQPEEAQQVAETVAEVVQKYGYRGCAF